jgi:hypothetical protein
VALQGEIRAGDQFEAGWLVVKVQWYEYHPEGNKGLQRAYKLRPGEKTIVVNPLLRIFGIKFEVGAAGEGGQRQLRSGSEAFSFLGSDAHNSIVNCIADLSND